jgi:hypothetical protein
LEQFLEVYEITKLAKVSSFGPASAFYQKLFGECTAEEESEFD